ncbi:uroporphyrinogen-III synthase [Oleomonas cavernae]|uniref:Uroporphyrinogen-III synthase n=1 Tax=Oleomonas cavernae TaxID=2320859 RepID=A0A418WHV5_9PROT|nr:uroporphyrinogen-III synthase [Oleomonas cavernae]
MRLLITRSAEEADSLATLLGAKGHDCLVAPLIEIVPRPGVAIDTTGVQGFLVTSANGARALSRATARRDLPVYAVGDASARCAADLGFVPVHSADGDVEALAALVAATARPRDGRLVHAAAATLAGDLAGRLRGAGFSVDCITLYDSVTATSLPPPRHKAWLHGHLTGFCFSLPAPRRRLLPSPGPRVPIWPRGRPTAFRRRWRRRWRPSASAGFWSPPAPPKPT